MTAKSKINDAVYVMVDEQPVSLLWDIEVVHNTHTHTLSFFFFLKGKWTDKA